jgi:hypothetical protein
VCFGRGRGDGGARTSTSLATGDGIDRAELREQRRDLVTADRAFESCAGTLGAGEAFWYPL